MTACINEPFSIEVHRKTRAEKSCSRMRKLSPDQVPHFKEVARLHCPSEVVVRLKRERMGMGHYVYADTHGSCSRVEGNCSTAKKLRVL